MPWACHLVGDVACVPQSLLAFKERCWRWWLLAVYAQEQLLGLVVILPLFCYIISMEAVVQSLPMHFLFIIIIITAAILM